MSFDSWFLFSWVVNCTIHGILQGTWFVAGRIRARLRWILQCPLRAPRSVGGHNDVWSSLSKNLRCRSVWAHGSAWWLYIYDKDLNTPSEQFLSFSHFQFKPTDISGMGWNRLKLPDSDTNGCWMMYFFDMCGHVRHLFHSSLEWYWMYHPAIAEASAVMAKCPKRCRQPPTEDEWWNVMNSVVFISPDRFVSSKILEMVP